MDWIGSRRVSPPSIHRASRRAHRRRGVKRGIVVKLLFEDDIDGELISSSTHVARRRVRAASDDAFAFARCVSETDVDARSRVSGTETNDGRCVAPTVTRGEASRVCARVCVYEYK